MWLFSVKINFFATSSSSLTKYKRINIWQLTWVFSIVSYHTLWQWKMWRHKCSVSSKGVSWLIVITLLNKNLLFLCIFSNDGSNFIFLSSLWREHMRFSATTWHVSGMLTMPLKAQIWSVHCNRLCYSSPNSIHTFGQTTFFMIGIG